VIAVDTSALMAVLLNEPMADACADALQAEETALISAGTVAEALIVAQRRNMGDAMERLIERLPLEIVAVTPAAATRIAQAYDRWGKGVHPAGLDFGDCFAYVVAKDSACPLLHVGNDFSKTDIKSVVL
jgi:ribonuclease VapC